MNHFKWLCGAVTLIVSTLQASPQSQSTNSESHSFKAPICFADRNRDEWASFKFDTVMDLYRRSFIKNPRHEKSLWDQDYLAMHPHVLKAIQEFNQGKRGQSVKSIKLRDKDAKEIHEMVLSNGFTYKKVPLRASLKNRTYWLPSGQTTKDASHPDVLQMYVYIHKDGGVVRLKPRGIPDLRGKHPRRHPHAVKAVLQNIEPGLCDKGPCDYDISYQNEAFKVSEDNRALPKAPSPKYGLKFPYKGLDKSEKRLNRLTSNAVMSFAYTNLKTSCPLQKAHF